MNSSQTPIQCRWRFASLSWPPLATVALRTELSIMERAPIGSVAELAAGERPERDYALRRSPGNQRHSYGTTLAAFDGCGGTRGSDSVLNRLGRGQACQVHAPQNRITMPVSRDIAEWWSIGL